MVRAKNFSFSGFDENAIKQFYDMFPFPLAVFAADGTAILINKALMKLNGIRDKKHIIGKYNLLDDPVCNGQPGLRDTIKKVFSGKNSAGAADNTVVVPDFRPPIQELVNRGVIREKPYESALMEVYLSKITDNGSLAFVVCVFIVKKIFKGNPGAARAKEYISQNWQGKFEPKATAQLLNMSVTQLYRIFKRHAGMTPGEYHRQCKIEHIKEKLDDKSLSIKQVLAACGENSQGSIQRIFKEETGITPAQWRKIHPPEP